MKKREKIKSIYQKHGVNIEEDYLYVIMRDKKRVKALMRVFKNEEIDSMNYIFGKPNNNKYFTKDELQIASKMNLFNRKLVEVYKKIWEREVLGIIN